MDCNYCNAKCIKKGWSLNKKQKYFCKKCHKYQLLNYNNNACKPETNKMVVKMMCNSSGILDISRVLEISTTTIINKIKRVASMIEVPTTFYSGRTYEVDELQTYVKNGEDKYWICCAFERETKRIMSLSVGKRTNETLLKSIKPVLLSNPYRIYSDKLPQYKMLIDGEIHRTKKRETNNIERQFLNFRTHIKRLFRKTICYSKSVLMLEAVVKIYLWNAGLIF